MPLKKKLLDRLLSRWYLPKDEHVQELNARYSKYQKELAESTGNLKRELDAIVRRCIIIDFQCGPHVEMYTLNLSFAPELMAMPLCTQDQLRYIAESVGRQVEYEIATTKFRETAYKNRLNDGPKFTPEIREYYGKS